MGLFSDIYNTVAKFFRPQEEIGDASKSVATNRLKLVLMQDRTNLTPRILEQMRSELIDLLSRYVELDKELLDLNFEQEGDQVALMLSIPVIRAKDEEEIEAAIKAHKEEIASEIDHDNEEETEGIDSSSESDEGDSSSDNIEQQPEEEILSAEEAQIEAEKVDAIAKELQTPKKMIKKKSVSQPESMGNNPFKPADIEEAEKIESSSES